MMAWDFAGLALKSHLVFQQTQCTIKETGVTNVMGSVRDNHRTLYLPTFYVSYKVNDQDRTTWARYTTIDANDAARANISEIQPAFELFRVNSSYPCWYDPKHPDMVVLRRDYDYGSLTMAGISMFIYVGYFALMGWLFVKYKILKKSQPR